MNEKILFEAQKLQSQIVTESEQAIANIAMDMVKKLLLDDECLLSCLLYYPYIKTAIYKAPSEKEFKTFDETKRKQEEERKEKIEEARLNFKRNIAATFGDGVLSFLHALKKLLEIDYKNQEEEAENIRKMFFALAKDVRIIIVKICFVLAEIKYIKNQTKNKSESSLLERDLIELKNAEIKSKQVLDLFAPLAARLGLSSIKSELEDISFEILHYEEYKKISEMVNKKYKEREVTVDKLKNQIHEFMNELGLSGEIMGRKKHIYSIHK
ncbi:MAG: bifunctional (p)ppGpp synthetase/guanosine-3',5'-bis(diphosphate) 3'-pyrophosphohydrolase, partial [Crenarchaeota archaeon]|nr:bifunctional (p)ppGpp synthetase/guanosine-3',5'-bis(diphosphate) 3'-pyrophosphohydrolase [Thermoproteota archaeon]